ncbi:hypothetical protein AB205_0093590 [Aquarana catesbeiana]|uniref:Uncharacterized protein n=1 Tax=Aquarana catesbeiana TaxID=8400 RepID=A0A2G9RZV2_AQUCT|nr:hypothetical protein AB205_0093590 [Aquarana catesbeiana]
MKPQRPHPNRTFCVLCFEPKGIYINIYIYIYININMFVCETVSEPGKPCRSRNCHKVFCFILNVIFYICCCQVHQFMVRRHFLRRLWRIQWDRRFVLTLLVSLLIFYFLASWTPLKSCTVF